MASRAALVVALSATMMLSGLVPTLPAVGVPPPLAEVCTFSNNGAIPYWVLVPGWTLSFEGVDEEGATITLVITTTADTLVVDGVDTRVVVEEEREDRKLVEISWNYMALCQETGDLYYFGEDVDIYEDGQVVGHEGAWHAGQDGARPGILMPGTPMVGMAYFQEVAPPVAMDFAAIQAVDETVTVPAGTFANSVHTLEGTPLEPGNIGEKHYAPGVGLIIDPPVALVGYGFGK